MKMVEPEGEFLMQQQQQQQRLVVALCKCSVRYCQVHMVTMVQGWMALTDSTGPTLVALMMTLVVAALAVDCERLQL